MTARPRLHATTGTGWVNDPLALTWSGGRYHLFLQHVPDGTTWAPECHWAHLTSRDLLQWEEEPVALAPGDGDAGCWSGCVVPGRTPLDAVLFYTSVDRDEPALGRVRVARPLDPDWRTWAKGEVVAEPPGGHDLVVFRDPCVVHDGRRWRMVVGAGRADGAATALVLSSADLRTWTPDGPLASRPAAEREPVWTGSAWECPQLFLLDGHWVLVVSAWDRDELHHVAWALGDLHDGRFEARTWGRLTHGPSYYAASAFVDERSRRGLVHWLRGVGGPADGWAGATSLPQVLAVRDGRLVAEPHPALARARTGAHPVGPGAPLRTVALVDVEWQPELGATLALEREGMRLATLAAVRSRAGSSLALETAAGRWAVPLLDGVVRVLLDGPVLEVLGAGGLLAAPLPGLSPVDVVDLRLDRGDALVHVLDPAHGVLG